MFKDEKKDVEEFVDFDAAENDLEHKEEPVVDDDQAEFSEDYVTEPYEDFEDEVQVELEDQPEVETEVYQAPEVEVELAPVVEAIDPEPEKKAKEPKGKKIKKAKGTKTKLGIHSIKTQVIAMLMLAVIVPIVATIIAVMVNVIATNEKDVTDSASIFVEQADQLVHAKIDSFMTPLEPTMMQLDSAVERFGKVTAVPMYEDALKKYMEASPYVKDAYLVRYEDQMMISATSGVTTVTTEFDYADWYLPAWDMPYTEWQPVLEDSHLIYRITKPIDTELEKALIVIEIDIEKIVAFAENIKVLDEGYAIITSREGLILFHKKHELIGSYLPEDVYKDLDIVKEDIVKDEAYLTQDLKTSFLDYKWADEGKSLRSLTYTQDPVNDWVLMTTFEVKEITNKIIPIVTTILIVVGVVLVIAIIFGVAFANRITKPISGLIDAMKRVEEGDLSVEFKTKSKTEVRVLGDSFNVMVGQLRTIILDMTGTFDNIETFVSSLSDTVEQTTLASNEISKSMLSVAEGAESQAVNTTQSVTQIEDMDVKILAVNTSAHEIKDSSLDAIELNAKGLEIVESLKGTSEESIEKSEHVIEEMKALSGRVSKISDIIKLINDISRQTNLLALNASIEAARAGEHGRGFAVVADEVSKLAEETGSAVKGIGDLLNDILDDAAKASDAIDKMQAISKKQNEEVDSSMKIFKEISSWINEISEKVNKIETDLEAAVRSKDMVSESINVISEVAQDSSAVSEEVSAATEEQLASLEQLESNTLELNSMIEEMNDSISSQFKL